MQERKKEVYRQIDFNIASIRLFSASKLSFACLNYLSKAVNCIRWVFAEWGGREEKIKIGAQWPCDDQCEQIGRLFKVQAKKLLTKVAQKHLLPILKSITLCKNCCGIYLDNFWKDLGYIFTPISGHTGNDWKVTMRCNQILSNQSLVSQPRGGEEACTPTTTTRSFNKMTPKTFPKAAQYRVSILFLFAVKLMAVVFIFVLSFQISRIPWLCSSNSLTLDNSGIKLSSYQSSSKPITWLCILYRHL